MFHLQQRVDYKEVQFFRRQIELNNYYGYFNLGQLYEHGNSIVKQNCVKAYVFYHFADKKGIKEAKNCIQSLEAKLLSEEWQEAHAIIRAINSKNDEDNELKWLDNNRENYRKMLRVSEE